MTPPRRGQTIGPFFHFALPYDGDRDLVAPGAPGAVRLHGTVYDGAGARCPDALVEIWQADPHGRVVAAAGLAAPRRPHLHRLRPVRHRPDGGTTPSPRSRPGGVDGGLPFFAVTVFARGLLNRLFTRAYLPLADGAVGPAAGLGRPATVARPCCASPTSTATAFDIRLQGEGETVFLRYPGH